MDEYVSLERVSFLCNVSDVVGESQESIDVCDLHCIHLQCCVSHHTVKGIDKWWVCIVLIHI